MPDQRAACGCREEHSCGNCEGIDPGTCLMNPDRHPPTPASADEALRNRIAVAARTVPIRLGPNALAMAQRGEPIILNMNEADAITEVALAEMRPLLAQTEEERDSYGRETDRLRRDWETMRTRAETAEAERDQALALADADSRQLAEVDVRCDTAEAQLRALAAGQNSLVSRPISRAVDGAETRVVRVAVTSPTAEDAESWARSVADMVIGDFADVMRLDVSVDGVPVPVEGGGQ